MLRSAERAGEAPPAVLTTTVPREYVHRAAVSEVFLTGWQQTGADGFTVTAEWPRSHSFYRTSRTRYDPAAAVRNGPAGARAADARRLSPPLRPPDDLDAPAAPRCAHRATSSGRRTPGGRCRPP
ncbi:AfsA-related hotdog domain-containing protein [Streptomyces sp. NPDC126510]|uniref:AfsA-related hotdog domain-containing protein n=1 Tax=Streptomyces sp. NPDC126510 TaxID=3155317 RepID=UPI00331C0931